MWPLFFFFCIDTNSAFLILELQNNESTVSSQFPEKSQGLMMSPGSLPPGSMEQHFEELEGLEKEYAMYNDTK